MAIIRGRAKKNMVPFQSPQNVIKEIANTLDAIDQKLYCWRSRVKAVSKANNAFFSKSNKEEALR